MVCIDNCLLFFCTHSKGVFGCHLPMRQPCTKWTTYVCTEKRDESHFHFGNHLSPSTRQLPTFFIKPTAILVQMWLNDIFPPIWFTLSGYKTLRSLTLCIAQLLSLAAVHSLMNSHEFIHNELTWILTHFAPSADFERPVWHYTYVKT